ncbi:GIY-YIG nuclease family protein [Corynebacterium riegelii]|uniref:GIY-YIG nuclease family protein n=1 Tax=Corynebacterium riegelii TaxID=156976 RepID=UPI00191EEA57|nr:GIY-YIG nuclease family protein [Corynebacterium riegelii]QQU84496.1 GIY-YIG nuclease family protein [Corynebacterium riegelii]
MAKQKLIQLFLIDGTADGPVKASILGWLGRVYSIPVQELRRPDINSRPDLNTHAIYFLVGTDNETDEPLIYVGQAGPRKSAPSLARVFEHLKNDERNEKVDPEEMEEIRSLEERAWFNRAIYLCTSDNSWGPTELNYLENAFYKLVKQVGTFQIGNKSEPPAGNVVEEHIPVLDDYIQNTRLILKSLGIDAFETPLGDASASNTSKSTITNDVRDTDPIFEIGSPNTFHGEARQNADKFVVLKGAVLSETIVPSAPRSVARNREIHAHAIQGNRLIKDIPFSSPTAAAAFLSGNSVSGPKAWKVKGRNISLAEWVDTDSPRPAEESANLAQVTEEVAEVVAATVTPVEEESHAVAVQPDQT